MPDLPDWFTQVGMLEAEAYKFRGGADTAKSATPVARDIYWATDTKKLYICVADGVWTGFDASILIQGIITLYANLVAGGYRITGLGAPTTQDDALRYGRAEIRNDEVAAAAAIAYSKLNLTGLIVNADIAAAAAIAYSKLNLALGIVNADIAAAAAIAYSKLALTGLIVNADIAAAAAIAYSKLALTGSIVNADIATAAAIAYSKLALTGSIVNADIATAAAIAYSKLALALSIVNADIAAAAAIAYSKLNLSLSIVNADIAAAAAIAYSKLNLSLSIVNADIAAAAAIAYSKLSLANSILTSDILSTEFNVASKLVKLDASADVPDAQIPSLAASKITSGRFGMAQMPDGTLGQVLTAQGASASPAYAAPEAGEGHITILPFNYNSIGQGSWIITFGTSYILGFAFNNWTTPANGDNVSFKAFLAAGTYTMRLLYHKADDRAIIDIDIDAAEVGSVDAYAASITYNFFYSVTGISIATSGLKTIKLRVHGKNASSTDWRYYVSLLALWRTA